MFPMEIRVYSQLTRISFVDSDRGRGTPGCIFAGIVVFHSHAQRRLLILHPCQGRPSSSHHAQQASHSIHKSGIIIFGRIGATFGKGVQHSDPASGLDYQSPEGAGKARLSNFTHVSRPARYGSSWKNGGHTGPIRSQGRRRGIQSIKWEHHAGSSFTRLLLISSQFLY